MIWSCPENIGLFEGVQPQKPSVQSQQYQQTPSYNETPSETSSAFLLPSGEEARRPAFVLLPPWALIASKYCALEQCWRVWACGQPRGCVWQQFFPSSARRTSASQNALRTVPQVHWLGRWLRLDRQLGRGLRVEALTDLRLLLSPTLLDRLSDPCCRCHVLQAARITSECLLRSRQAPDQQQAVLYPCEGGGNPQPRLAGRQGAACAAGTPVEHAL